MYQRGDLVINIWSKNICLVINNPTHDNGTYKLQNDNGYIIIMVWSWDAISTLVTDIFREQ